MRSHHYLRTRLLLFLLSLVLSVLPNITATPFPKTFEPIAPEPLVPAYDDPLVPLFDAPNFRQIAVQDFLLTNPDLRRTIRDVPVQQGKYYIATAGSVLPTIYTMHAGPFDIGTDRYRDQAWNPQGKQIAMEIRPGPGETRISVTVRHLVAANSGFIAIWEGDEPPTIQDIVEPNLPMNSEAAFGSGNPSGVVWNNGFPAISSE